MASAVATTTKKMITLKSSDGEKFEVEETVAMESQTIRHVIEDVCADNGIPLPNVTSKILPKVIEYCKKHVDAVSEDDLKAWDAEFVKVNQTTLYGLILAANYLDIKGLLDMTCQEKIRRAEEIREICREQLRLLELPIRREELEELEELRIRRKELRIRRKELRIRMKELRIRIMEWRIRREEWLIRREEWQIRSEELRIREEWRIREELRIRREELQIRREEENRRIRRIRREEGIRRTRRTRREDVTRG